LQVSAKDAIVVGNPTMPTLPPEYGNRKLTPLTGAKKEAQAIASILNTTALTDNEATETAVKAKLSQAKIIHFATHGLFDDIQGLRSALAFAPSEKDNGLFTAEEILGQKLNADLVVLSACDTGRGNITGDGVIGLSRSLISAGTPSVVVSLWAVPDEPTAELMKEFYTNMFEKKLDKAQALRQAMLKFKDKSPKNWAAFTLIGESE
jgi:CHAT domain-containing protein